MLITFEYLDLLDGCKKQEYNDCVEKDDEADVSCKWFSLADYFLFIPVSNLERGKVVNYIGFFTGQSRWPSQIWTVLILVKLSFSPQFLGNS